MLISETAFTKQAFEQAYPDKYFATLDLYTELQGGEPDYKADLCGDVSNISERFGLIICQATLEHVYSPFEAVRNLFSLLRPDGVLQLYTHTPPFEYHPYPRDYCRFMPDWFEDLPKHLPDLKLLQLYATDGHIFSAFRRGTSAQGHPYCNAELRSASSAADDEPAYADYK